MDELSASERQELDELRASIVELAPVRDAEQQELDELRAFARYISHRWPAVERAMGQLEQATEDIADMKAKVVPAMDKLNSEGIMGLFGGALGRKRG